MLVLTRKVGDIIAIGDNVKVVVMAIKGKQVRLGIEADRSTVVHREEIYQRIKQETSAAAQISLRSSSAAKEILNKNEENYKTPTEETTNETASETKETSSATQKKAVIIRRKPL